MERKIVKRAAAAVIALLTVTGYVPIQPIADVIGDISVSVSAAS